MKKLFLVRHAKSSWDFPYLSDKDRPLSKRGNRDAPLMASHVHHEIGKPDIMICSTSKRTLETAKYFFNEFKLTAGQIVRDEELYHAGAKNFESVISRIDEKYESAMLFSHNPGITDYLNQLSDTVIDNVPTCGVAVIHLSIDRWDQIKGIEGKLIHYFYPKGI